MIALFVGQVFNLTIDSSRQPFATRSCDTGFDRLPFAAFTGKSFGGERSVEAKDSFVNRSGDSEVVCCG